MRWNFELKDHQLVASPRLEEMQNYIADRCEELNKQLAKTEELLVISSLATPSLERLQTLVKEELKRRKDFKIQI